MRIRAETEADHDAIRALVAAAFRAEGEAVLVDRLRQLPTFTPELSLVADDGGAVVGHVLVTDVDLVDGTTAFVIPSLAPLAVAPDRQKEGIGGALVRAVAARLDERGQPLVVLQGSPAYYGRFGFEPSAPLGITMDLPEWAPPEAAQLLKLAAYDPALRGHIVYPPAFDGL